MNEELRKVRDKLDGICKEIVDSSNDDKGNKFLCYNSTRTLVWYVKQSLQMLDIVIQSDSSSGIGKTLNTQFIVLKENASPDQKSYWLHITLTNLSDIKTFNELILDLIEFSNEAASGSEGVSLIVERFSMWKNMLKHKGEEKGIVKGIVGELITIKHLLEIGKDCEVVIEGWGGPQKTQQDFILDRFWIETKTVGEDPSVVTINNLGQLDNPGMPGYLYVINVKTSDKEKAVSIDYLYKKICWLLEKSGRNDVLLAFKTKMREFEYDRFCLPATAYKCEVIKERVYSVKDDFPRLFNRYQMPGIKTVRYDLLLSALDKWNVGEGTEVWK